MGGGGGGGGGGGEGEGYTDLYDPYIDACTSDVWRVLFFARLVIGTV